MVAAIERRGNLRREDTRQNNEQHRRCADRYQCGRIDLRRIVPPLMVGKPEKSGFHAVKQYDEHQRHVCVDIGDDTVLFGGEQVGVHRHQTPVQKPPYDAADTIDGGIFHKSFYSCHGRLLLIVACIVAGGVTLGLASARCAVKTQHLGGAGREIEAQPLLAGGSV